MKFVTYNIQYGLGKDDRYDPTRIASGIEEADVIALQEVERHWQRSGCCRNTAPLRSLPLQRVARSVRKTVPAFYCSSNAPCIDATPFSVDTYFSADLKPML